MSDAELLNMYHDRDERAIQVTMRRYRSYLMKIAVQILGDEQDAEECVNDTYHAAWNTVPEKNPEVLSAYLGKIVRQKAIDRLRTRQRIKRQGTEYAASLEELSEVVAGGTMPEQEAEAALLREAIAKFVKTLPEESRTLFVGRYFYFDSLKETASYSGMSESKAKSKLFRIRCDLRKYLEKEGFFV
ncbi:MAG: sigma-70 family RNA polymerase sigma factor [Lachnospiraceae bacterium]|nr:sigma-70 family RNA polymerase sigma factor [Lachnospiraceae bacterium]